MVAKTGPFASAAILQAQPPDDFQILFFQRFPVVEAATQRVLEEHYILGQRILIALVFDGQQPVQQFEATVATICDQSKFHAGIAHDRAKEVLSAQRVLHDKNIAILHPLPADRRLECVRRRIEVAPLVVGRH